MTELPSGQPDEGWDPLSRRVGAVDPVVLGLVAFAVALVGLDLSFHRFSKWTMDHPAVTAVVTGVLVGLIAGLLLDRRARQREQARYRFLRLEGVKAMCAAAHSLILRLPIDKRNEQEFAMAEDALRTFKRELSSWQSVLLAIDEAGFLRHCYECAEHFSTALWLTRHPEQLPKGFSTLQSDPRELVDDDSAYFANQEERISNEELQKAEAAIYHHILKSSQKPRRVRKAEREMAKTAKQAEAVRADVAARLTAEEREKLLTRIYSESEPAFRQLLLILADRTDPTEPMTYADIAAAHTDWASTLSIAQATAAYDYQSIDQYRLYCPFRHVLGKDRMPRLSMDSEVASFLLRLDGEHRLPIQG